VWWFRILHSGENSYDNYANYQTLSSCHRSPCINFYRATFDKFLVTVHHLFVLWVQELKYSTLPAMFPLSYHIYSSLKKIILPVSHSHISQIRTSAYESTASRSHIKTYQRCNDLNISPWLGRLLPTLSTLNKVHSFS